MDAPKPRIFKTILSFDEGGANMHLVDTIEYEGILCLVGEWLESPAQGYRIPARLIGLGNHRFQPNPEPGPGWADFSITGLISKAVFEGRAPAATMPGCVVVERPDLRFPLPPSHQH